MKKLQNFFSSVKLEGKKEGKEGSKVKRKREEGTVISYGPVLAGELDSDISTGPFQPLISCKIMDPDASRQGDGENYLRLEEFPLPFRNELL